MKTAIVYYSMSGNTAFAAQEVAADIPADLVPLVPHKAYPSKGVRKFIWGGKAALMGDMPELEPYEFDADAYDRIVFGSPVWASSFAPPLRTFIRDQGDALSGKRFAAFVCMGGSGDQKALDKLRELLGVDSFEATMTLIDPKDKPTRENEHLIREFCSQLG